MSTSVGGLFWVALLGAPAWAADDPSAPLAAEEGEGEGEGEGGGEGDVLSPYRLPFETLVRQSIGSTSTPVAFNWRRTRVHVAATGNHFFELNNFNSLRAGGLARFPTNGVLLELGLSYVWVWDTPSSELLALTPYRQPGRPPRLELDAMVAFPLAEGVVTTVPRFFPAVQMVFNVYGGVRYLIYPSGFAEMRVREVAGAVLAPTLTRAEERNLEAQRLDAMQIDSGRYGIMAGFGDDIYFAQGVFVSPRLLLAVPLLAPITETELLFWADISVVVGVAL